MKKKRGYMVVRASSADELTEFVTGQIKDGWEPHGSLAILPATKITKTTFYQPMVKE